MNRIEQFNEISPEDESRRRKEKKPEKREKGKNEAAREAKAAFKKIEESVVKEGGSCIFDTAKFLSSLEELALAYWKRVEISHAMGDVPDAEFYKEKFLNVHTEYESFLEQAEKGSSPVPSQLITSSDIMNRIEEIAEREIPLKSGGETTFEEDDEHRERSDKKKMNEKEQKPPDLENPGIPENPEAGKPPEPPAKPELSKPEKRPQPQGLSVANKYQLFDKMRTQSGYKVEKIKQKPFFVSAEQVVDQVNSLIKQFSSDNFRKKSKEEQIAEIRRSRMALPQNAAFQRDLIDAFEAEGIATRMDSENFILQKKEVRPEPPDLGGEERNAKIERYFADVNTEEELLEKFESRNFLDMFNAKEEKVAESYRFLSYRFASYKDKLFLRRPPEEKRQIIEADLKELRLPDALKKAIRRVVENEGLLKYYGDTMTEGSKPAEGTGTSAAAEQPIGKREYWDNKPLTAEEQAAVESFDVMAKLNSDPGFATFVSHHHEDDVQSALSDKRKAMELYENFQNLPKVKNAMVEALNGDLSIQNEKGDLMKGLSLSPEERTAFEAKIEQVAISNPEKYKEAIEAIKESGVLNAEYAELKKQIEAEMKGKDLAAEWQARKENLAKLQVTEKKIASAEQGRIFHATVEGIFDFLNGNKSKKLDARLKSGEDMSPELRGELEVELELVTSERRAYKDRNELKEQDIKGQVRILKKLEDVRKQIEGGTQSLKTVEDFAAKKAEMDKLLNDARQMGLGKIFAIEGMHALFKDQIIQTIQEANSPNSSVEQLAAARAVIGRYQDSKEAYPDVMVIAEVLEALGDTEKQMLEEIQQKVGLEVKKMIADQISSTKGSLFAPDWLVKMNKMVFDYGKKKLGAMTGDDMKVFFNEIFTQLASEEKDAQKKTGYLIMAEQIKSGKPIVVPPIIKKTT